MGKQFLRLPLGTSNKDAANVTVDHIERALSEGQTSLRWPELKNILPPKTFDALATVGSYREPELKSEAPKPKTWDDLERAFLAKLELRIQTKDMAESTRERYKQTLRAFSEYLKEKSVYDLPAMDTPLLRTSSCGAWQRFKRRNSRVVDVASPSILPSCIEHPQSL